MTENLTINANDHAKTQELQHLITVSTGFIDAYIIQCFAKAPMLLPQMWSCLHWTVKRM